MTISDRAKDIIAQAIYRNTAMASLFATQEQLALMVAAIERDLEAGGYVVVLASELGLPEPEGPNP